MAYYVFKIDVNRVGDAMNFDTMQLCSGDECVAGWIDHLSENDEIKINNITWVKKEYFRRQWDRMLKCIPTYIQRASSSSTSQLLGQGISSTAYSIMEKMGWAGGPLINGRGEKGILKPVETGDPRPDREGLGFTKKKKVRRRIAAYEVGGGEIQYAKGSKGLLKSVELDPMGKPVVSGENLPWYSAVKEILYWGGAVKGIAEYSYPHPRGWTFKEMCKEIPLDKIQVKDTTTALAAASQAEPTCKTAWTNRHSSWHVNVDVDWSEFGSIFQSRLLTNSDFQTYFKYIVHRRLYVRAFMPEEDGYNRCRCCHSAKETQLHLHRCNTLWGGLSGKSLGAR